MLNHNRALNTVQWPSPAGLHPRRALAPHCQRQWPQMGEVVSSRDLIAQVEGNFPELTLESADDVTSRTPSSSNGPAITATDASTETSASPSSATARPLQSPTIGANPPPRPNGADHSPVASTCPPTEFGKTHNIFRTTSASEPTGACGGDRLGGGRGQFASSARRRASVSPSRQSQGQPRRVRPYRRC